MPAHHNLPHDPSRWPAERIVVHSWDEVPEFQNECEEQEYWSTHEMGDEFFDGATPDPDELAIIERARQRRAHRARA
ncbi:MAG: hypothetical protein ACRDJE_16195 [Dehalococcoidia bacterium]